jgi:hypothetical protein
VRYQSETQAGGSWSHSGSCTNIHCSKSYLSSLRILSFKFIGFQVCHSATELPGCQLSTVMVPVTVTVLARRAFDNERPAPCTRLLSAPGLSAPWTRPERVHSAKNLKFKPQFKSRINPKPLSATDSVSLRLSPLATPVRRRSLYCKRRASRVTGKSN